MPLVLPGDGVAASPELGGDALVGDVAEHAPELSVLDLPADLGGELEVEPLVVDAPALVGGGVDAVVGLGDHLLEAGVAGGEAHVGHADEGGAVPAAGAHGASAAEGLLPLDAEAGGGLAGAEVAGEDSLLHEIDALGGDAFVVVAEAAHGAGNAGVGVEVHDVGAIAQAVELVGGEEGGAGEAALGAEDAVELGGVAAGFVDLEGELAAFEDEGGDFGGAGVGGDEGDGLFGDATGVSREVHGLDELPPEAGVVAAEGSGEGAALHFAAALGDGLDAAAGLDARLDDVGAFAGGEPLLLADEVELAGGDADAGDLAHDGIGFEQERELLVQGYGERVDPVVRRPLPLDRVQRCEGDLLGREGGAGASDADGQVGGGVDVLRSGRGGGGESPGAVGDEADADAPVVGVAQAFGHAILGVDLLGSADDGAGVGVGGAGGASALDGAHDEFSHGRFSLPHMGGATWARSRYRG